MLTPSSEVVAGTRDPLLAPFPYFGGKRTIASTVWRAPACHPLEDRQVSLFPGAP